MLTEADGPLRLSRGGEPIASLHWQAQPRPFLFPVCAPGGLSVTRSFPMEEAPGEAQDHPHHQSLWFAHGAVNGYDFWHGSGDGERMVARGAPTVEDLEDGTRISLEYDWLVGESELVCREQRTWTIRSQPDANVFDASFTLRATDQPLVLGDTKEGTFALRLHPQLRVQGAVASGELLNSEGQRGGEVWGRRARWIEASGAIDGEPIGVLLLDHPSNPRHPTWWHARTYGLLAANPFGQHDFEGVAPGTGDLTLAPGDELTLRYRVIVHTGRCSPEQAEAAWRGWAAQ